MFWHSLQLGQRAVSIHALVRRRRARDFGSRRRRPPRPWRGARRRRRWRRPRRRFERLLPALRSASHAARSRASSRSAWESWIPACSCSRCQSSRQRRVGLHQPRIDDDAVQPVVGIDRPHVRDALGRRTLGQLQPFATGSMPAFQRSRGTTAKCARVAAVAEHEVGIGERDVLGHALHRLVRVVERLAAAQSASGLRLCSSEKRVRPVVAGRPRRR